MARGLATPWTFSEKDGYGGVSELALGDPEPSAPERPWDGRVPVAGCTAGGGVPLALLLNSGPPEDAEPDEEACSAALVIASPSKITVTHPGQKGDFDVFVFDTPSMTSVVMTSLKIAQLW